MVFGVMVEHLFGKAEEDAEQEVDRVERVAPVALRGDTHTLGSARRPVGAIQSGHYHGFSKVALSSP